MAFPDTGARDKYPTNPQPRRHKSVVVGEFVDEIPQIAKGKWVTKTHVFAAQDGVKEALEKAMNHKGKAMVLVEYNEGAPSRKRTLAELRERAMIKSGYSEENGWVVRAVENKVYVLWRGI